MKIEDKSVILVAKFRNYSRLLVLRKLESKHLTHTLQDLIGSSAEWVKVSF